MFIEPNSMLLHRKLSNTYVNHIIIPKYEVGYLPNTVLFSIGEEKDKLNKSFEITKRRSRNISSVAGRWFSSKLFNYFNKYFPLSSECSSAC